MNSKIVSPRVVQERIHECKQMQFDLSLHPPRDPNVSLERHRRFHAANRRFSLKLGIFDRRFRTKMDQLPNESSGISVSFSKRACNPFSNFLPARKQFSLHCQCTPSTSSASSKCLLCPTSVPLCCERHHTDPADPQTLVRLAV